mgnify:CR=1 FL=1
MQDKSNISKLVTAGLFFLIPPFLLYFTGDIAGRTLLKDAISIATIAAFVLMLGQFFLSRLVSLSLTMPTMGSVIKLHKIVGYVAAAVLLSHPLLITVPRFFEAGVSPRQAFVTMISAGTPGITTGIAVWILLLLIVLMSALRKWIPLSYRDWRKLHGLMSMMFVSLAAFHSIYLGRHFDLVFAGYTVILIIAGVSLLLQKYVHEFFKQREKNKWITIERAILCPDETL